MAFIELTFTGIPTDDDELDDRLVGPEPFFVGFRSSNWVTTFTIEASPHESTLPHVKRMIAHVAEHCPPGWEFEGFDWVEEED